MTTFPRPRWPAGFHDEETTTMTTMINPDQIVDAFGISWPNAETQIVQAYLANKTSVMLEMREAARTYFCSPYRHWNEVVPTKATPGKTFAEYARRVIERAVNTVDPGHDAEETLTMRLVECCLDRADWEAIAAWWHAAAASECEIHSASI